MLPFSSNKLLPSESPCPSLSCELVGIFKTERASSYLCDKTCVGSFELIHSSFGELICAKRSLLNDKHTQV